MSDQEMYNAAKRSGATPIKKRMKIEKCSGDYFYKSIIGQEVTIVQYGTFGCFDAQGRWYYFYDLKEVQ